MQVRPEMTLAPEGSIDLLRGGAEAFPRMLEAIARARRLVYLEVYTFMRDQTGERFVEALIAARGRGVRVEVRVDGLGSWVHGRSLERALKAAGCRVRIYHPLRSLFTGRLRRDHRKALVVDDEAIFVGGINIGDDYGKPIAQGGWLDLMLELKGEKWRWAAERIRGLPGPSWRSGVRVMLSGEEGGRRLRRRYTRAFGGARKSVRLAQAYFLPERRLIRALRLAAKRGVEVQLLLPGRSDIPLLPTATRRVYRRLLAAGVEIREWRGSVLHAKLGLIDGERLLLGSFNLDPLSMVNLEVLLEVREPPVVDDAERWFAEYAQASHKVRPEECERPGFRGWLDQILGALFLRVARLARRLISTEREKARLPPGRQD